MDPVAVLGSTVGVISLGIQVTQSLVDFYNANRYRDTELAGIIGRLESLAETFQYLAKALTGRTFRADEQSLVKNIEMSIASCDEMIQELHVECQKFSETSSTGIRATARVAGRRITYPFRQSTLQKLDEDIGEMRINLSIALDVLHLNDTQRFHEDVTEMKALLESVQTNQISSGLRDWLSAPDAFVDHNAACAKKHPGTGTWLVKGSHFSEWMVEENSVMWLRGFAGSGKSVLCSTAIQSVLRHRGYDRSIGVVFFYFTFNDDSKQDESSMLRTLLLQLSSQLQDGYTDLTRLHESYKAGRPPSPVLLEYLRRLIQRFHHVYILLDALDESPRSGSRVYVLDALQTIRQWGMGNLHLFVTSRDELDIHESLNLSTVQQVAMSNTGIDQDIVDFISGRLSGDRRLRRLLPYQDKIQEALAQGARGVFRWVECQLRSLQTCPRSEDHLDKVLNSLPPSLDETYERMLCNIDSYLIEDARRILTLLCFASRPLKVQELIDGVAVEIDGSVGLNRKRRLQDSDDIRDICRGLVDIGLGASQSNEPYYGKDLTPTVRIAHFSVQEYLESERIRYQKAANFSLNSTAAYAEISEICLVYLLERSLSSLDLNESVVEEFPLAHFAAVYWYRYYRDAGGPAARLHPLILELFQDQHRSTTWVRLHDIDQPWNTSIDFDRRKDTIGTPVYYASLLGLDKTLHDLTDRRRVESVTTIINTNGGRVGNALQAACSGGHDKVVQMLLEKGADINAQGGQFGSALQAASYRGHDKVMQILLDKGAKKAPGDNSFTAHTK